jgi:hypothetical protein
MGFLASVINVDQPACRAPACGAHKSNAAFTSDQAKAAKKDLACLGKGLAYNVTVADVAGDVPRNDDHAAAVPV